MAKKRYIVTTEDWDEDDLEFEEDSKGNFRLILSHLAYFLLAFMLLWTVCYYKYSPACSDDLFFKCGNSRQPSRSHDASMVKPFPLKNYTCTIIRLKTNKVANKTNGIQNGQENLTDAKKFDDHLYESLPVFFRKRRVPKEGNFPQLLRIRRNANITEGIFDDLDIRNGSVSCQLPNGLKTAEMLCKRWPRSVTCKSYCVYGSTYKEGIMRTHSCNYQKDRWSEDFEECKPFVDCKLKLVSPGAIKCVENRVNESPACQISCEIYEDKDAIDNKVYDCKSKGTWDPPLPHCVALKGTRLVPAPKVTEHADVSYPVTQGMK